MKSGNLKLLQISLFILSILSTQKIPMITLSSPVWMIQEMQQKYVHLAVNKVVWFLRRFQMVRQESSLFLMGHIVMILDIQDLRYCILPIPPMNILMLLQMDFLQANLHLDVL